MTHGLCRSFEVGVLAFIEPGVKVNRCYYRDKLLSKNLLPDIRRVAGDTFVFQQDNAHAHPLVKR